MTRRDLIRARVDNATPGPWWWHDSVEESPTVAGQEGYRYLNGDDGVPILDVPPVTPTAYVNPGEAADMELIAAAPDDLVWLLARLDTLENALREAADSFDYCERTFGGLGSFSALCATIARVALAALDEA